MKKLICLLGVAVLGAISYTLSANNIETAGTDTLISSHGITSNKTITLHRGETKQLVGYISLVDPQTTRHRVYNFNEDYIDLHTKLLTDIRAYLTAKQKNKTITRTDTLFLDADSVSITMSNDTETTNRKSKKYYSLTIKSYYNDGSKTSYASSIDLTDKDYQELTDLLEEYLDENESETYIYSPCKRSISSGFVWGYGYLNYSKDGLFSTPSSSDPYYLKWSDKWDIIYRFTFCPDKVVSFTTGIGIQSNVFRFDNGFDIDEFGFGSIPSSTSSTSGSATSLSSDISLDKCKLVARYITIPVIFDFNFSEHFHLHAGAIAGINYRNSHTGFKRNYTLFGDKIEQSTGSHFKEFNAFKVDCLLGIEIYGFTFYVSHSVMDMFKDSYQKDALPFAFGVMIGL